MTTNTGPQTTAEAERSSDHDMLVKYEQLRSAVVDYLTERDSPDRQLHAVVEHRDNLRRLVGFPMRQKKPRRIR